MMRISKLLIRISIQSKNVIATRRLIQQDIARLAGVS